MIQDSYFRLGAPIERPTQAQVQAMLGCRTELAWNETLHACHYGEDGPGICIVIERELHIEHQMTDDIGGYQDWFLDELMDRAYDSYDTFCQD
jgi:hypothetical protein